MRRPSHGRHSGCQRARSRDEVCRVPPLLGDRNTAEEDEGANSIEAQACRGAHRAPRRAVASARSSRSVRTTLSAVRSSDQARIAVTKSRDARARILRVSAAAASYACGATNTLDGPRSRRPLDKGASGTSREGGGSAALHQRRHPRRAVRAGRICPDKFDSTRQVHVPGIEPRSMPFRESVDATATYDGQRRASARHGRTCTWSSPRSRRS